jgi:hypothetical protein
MRSAKDTPEGPACQVVKLLNRLNRGLQKVKHGAVFEVTLMEVVLR